MSSPKAADGLDPATVYRPPPTQSPEPASNTYLRIDESEDPKYRLRLRLAWVIRFCLAWLAFGPFLGFTIVGGLGSSRRFTITIYFELLIVIIWQIFHLFPQASRVSRGLSRRLPRISLQIGDASYVVGGGSDGDIPAHEYQTQPPKKNLAWLVTTAVDLSFGATLIIFGALWTDARCNNYYGCYWPLVRDHIPSIVLTIILGCLMVVTALLSFYKTYHTMAFEFSIYKDGTVQPISLGPPAAEVSSRREPVSISA